MNRLPVHLQLLACSSSCFGQPASSLASSSAVRRRFAVSRRASSSTSANAISPFSHASPVPNRKVISVGGRDAAKFLNGITAVKIPEGFQARPFYGSFLHAQGRILFDVHIYPHPPTSTYLIDYDPRTAPALIETIKKFVLRSKVALRDVSDQWDVWAAWAPQGTVDEDGVREWKWGAGGSAGLVGWEKEQTSLPTRDGEDALTVEVGGWDLRAPGMGWRGLVRRGDRPFLAPPSAPETTSADGESYTVHRMLVGVPEGIEDIVPMSSLPSESNLDFMGGVDFRKGCYVGQELTVRTYHTGATRKRIVPVRLVPSSQPDDDSCPLIPPPTGTDIRLTSAASARGRSSGRMLGSATTSEGDVVGLALLRLEQVGAVTRGEGEMTIEVEGGAKWNVQPREPDWWPRMVVT